jgi:hypothetical protein
LDQYCQRRFAKDLSAGTEPRLLGCWLSREYQGRHGNADDYLSHRSPCFVDWR